ncbi:cell cycle checkpoint protein RAD1 isoform X2 [Bombyx mandarina]|uniref:Cell cycle checkpoint protein RAD1 n=2 Tax=Bombyx TaxID=7090 RepID=A0A8R2AJT2_BOMMO|nr:cell cycle checkpoint protein RAD1 isoform X2 [Bombyx mori]XP_004922752.1 cell cycle checkpoint protein RAD1 isoform X2 [Bombyx mori]XP_012552424.1 cell cycle checkpoint protein RAD1 isoform X2 [Bombyx mori]XP_012552426.1 cell cycle checkpoint protein RAD1 isoform X2 [Bombyx mori]XP_028026813.1 cell cycle checkpoint protein RAD1 isoform X2 [Bombyx mandarina]XP_037872388.1 cell cycle checkpoint protein RAD1 isoform X2 [Bombyx mori]
MAEDSSQYHFTASMDSGKTLCSLLKAIQFQESAVFCALPEGLKLTVEEGKCVQASAYIPADNFTEYHVRDDVDVIFKISLAVLAECLNIFGSGEEASLKMYYKCEGSPLLLVLQPQSFRNVMTDCEIWSQTPDSMLELRSPEETDVAKLVVRAGALLAVLGDVERSADVLELRLQPEPPHFTIVTYGMQDRSCIEVPECSDTLQSFSCERELTLKYQLHHLRLCMKALAISNKVVLRCSSTGLLLLQLKLERDDNKHMFSEFYIVPLLDD